MNIVPYDPKYKQAFIALNKQWINEMFTLEPEDLAVLEGIEASLAQGGQVFFAVDDQDEVLAACMIAPLPNGEWEIEKFCARGMYTGTGAGAACLKAWSRLRQGAAGGKSRHRLQPQVRPGPSPVPEVWLCRDPCGQGEIPL